MRVFSFFVFFALAAAQCFAASRFPGGESGKTFSTNGITKSKGLDMSIDFPSSWSVEDGKRPNTVALATSENGLGLEVCALVINTMEQAGLPADSAKTETSASFSNRERLEAVAAANGGRLIDGGAANLESLTSRWTLIASNVSRDGSQISYRSANWQILYKDLLITLACTVGSKTEQDADSRLRRMLPTFRLIANSIVIPSRWR